MPPPLGAGGIMFSGCPSACPSEAWNTLIWPVHGSVGPPDEPSVRPERFPGICGRTHKGNGLKFYKLMYLDHFQNWLVYGHGLLIFVILALFWLSETGQIWGIPGISQRTHGGNGLKFCTLMNLDHLQNWLVYGHGPFFFFFIVFYCPQSIHSMTVQ